MVGSSVCEALMRGVCEHHIYPEILFDRQLVLVPVLLIVPDAAFWRCALEVVSMLYLVIWRVTCQD